jgi:hypothetical protein
MLLSLYGLYAGIYLPIKIVHKFDSKRAIMTVCGYFGIITVLLAILFGIIFILALYSLYNPSFLPSVT